MKASPLKMDGDFRPVIVRTAEILGCDASDLFTDVQMNTVLKSNRRSLQVNEAEMKFMLEREESHPLLLEDQIEQDEKTKLLYAVLHKFPDRTREIVTLHFGLIDGRCLTYREIGKHMGISQERVRQIIAQTLRRIRMSKDKEMTKILGEGLKQPCWNPDTDTYE